MDLSTYIPIDRRRAMANRAELPDHTFGAALVADISGYTPLAASLVQQLGRDRGVDELTQRLNRAFAVLVEQIHQYHGTVITFNGDALTAWFDGDHGHRAVTAALRMQAGIQVLSQNHDLRIMQAQVGVKVAVVQGSARRFIVGSPEIQQFDFLGGELLAHLARAEHHTRLDEVVVGPEVVAHLQDLLVTGERRLDATNGRSYQVIEGIGKNAPALLWANDLKQHPAISAREVRQWLHPDVYIRLQQGRAEFLAELRPAVALFLKFDNLNYDQDWDAQQSLHDCVQWVQRVAQQRGGALIDLSCGDRGTYCYVAFGAPQAHDNNATRAIAAAADFQRSALAVVHNMQIGIASGQMRVGAYGSLARRTYGVLGDAVNLAARLVGVAPPGSIRCDYETYQAARNDWAFTAHLPVRVKGKVELVRVYEPTARRGPTGMLSMPAETTPLIGRDEEIAQLHQALDAIEAGHDQIMVVTGEAGVGKTGLVGEFVSLIRQRGLPGLMGTGQSVELHTPYRAWRDILTAYFDLDELGSVQEQIARIDTLIESIAPDQKDRLPLLYDLLNLPSGASELNLTPALRHQNLALLALALLRAWAKAKPLILVFEDAQWLDSASWELLVQIARSLHASLHPFLLLITARPLDKNGPGANGLAQLQSVIPFQAISLRPLTNPDIKMLVASQLKIPPSHLPPALTGFVQGRAGGNPFFAIELVAGMRSRQIIQMQYVDGVRRCMLNGDLSLAEETMPDTLRGLVLARLDRLPPEQRLLLKVAAVIGVEFWVSVLHRILRQFQPNFDDNLQNHLAMLAAAGLIQAPATATEQVYAFQHVVFQQVAYQTLLLGQRKQLHGLVLKLYENVFAGIEPEADTGSLGSASQLLPRLVHHARQAGDRRKERTYALKAGESAAAHYAHLDAITYFTRVLSLTAAGETEDRLQVLLLREEANHILGKRSAQATDVKLLALLADVAGDVEIRARVALRRARLALATSDIETAVIAVQEATGLASICQSPSLLSQSYHEWGQALISQNRFDSARRQLQLALRYAREASAPGPEASSLRALGVALAYQGQYQVAVGYFMQALPLYRQSANHIGESKVLDNLGTSLSYLGDHAGALTYYQQSLAISETVGNRDGTSRTLNNLGIVYAAIGDYESGQRCLEQGLQISREIGDRHGENLALSNLGMILNELGQFAAGLRSNQAALELARSIGADQDMANAFHGVGDSFLGLQQWAAAATAFTHAIGLRQSLGQTQTVAESQAGLAIANLYQDRPQAAMDLVAQVLAYLNDHGADGIEAPILVYFRCHQVLLALEDDGADAAILAAHNLLLEQAERIPNAEMRAAFLEQVPHHHIVSELADALVSD